MCPSAIFYDDTLEPCAQGNGTVSWSGLANPKLPLMFIGNDSPEDCIDEVLCYAIALRLDITHHDHSGHHGTTLGR